MQNEYTNKPGQSAADKAGEFARSAGQEIENKGKDMADDAQKMLKQGKESISKSMEKLDHQVHENPWPVIAGVAIGSFIFASLICRASK